MPINTDKLTRLGYDTGTPEKAMSALMAYVAKRPQGPLSALAAAMPKDMDDKSLAHFMGQAAHETGYWRYLREIWGPTAAQKGYEGRKDLGNTEPGDGRKYMGRGIFQATGRYNYAHLEKVLGLPLVEHPELLEMPDHAVAAAVSFWNDRKLSELAQSDDVHDACSKITHRINGGQNGIDDRLAMTQRAFSVLA